MVLFVFLILQVSCSRQERSAERTFESKAIPAARQGTYEPFKDPTFVVTADTFSVSGPASITRNVIQDRNGNYWFATWEGIIRYDGKLTTNMTLKEGLRQFHVFSLLEDRSGNIWFGTIGGGLYRYDGTSFRNYVTEDGLAGNVILCLLQARNGDIWIGTDNGVSRYNGSTFTNYTTRDGLHDNFINSIAQDKNGKLWLGTNGGVNCYQHGAGSLDGNVFTNFTNQPAPFSFHNVRAVLANKSGKIWIGSQEGLSLYDPTIAADSGVQNLIHIRRDFVGSMFEDKFGILWLSVGKINTPEMTLMQYDGTSFNEIFSATQVFGITEDKDGYIWFGTEKGVNRYDPTSLTITTFNLD